RVPAGLGAGVRGARRDLGRALRARLQAADGRMRPRLRRLHGVARAAPAALAAPARPRRARPARARPGLPEPLRPAARPAHLARARRAPPRARRRDRRAARGRDRGQGLQRRRGAARRAAPARLPRAGRVLRRRGRDPRAPVLRARPGRGGLQLLDAGQAPPPDRDARLLAPARRLEARRPPRRLDRGQARLDRPRRRDRRRRRHAQLAARARARRPGRRRLLARPRHRRAARHRLGGRGRRLDRVREGALAAVPDLARPARPARRRPARTQRHVPAARGARAHAGRVLPRQPRPARPELDRLGAARAQRAARRHVRARLPRAARGRGSAGVGPRYASAMPTSVVTGGAGFLGSHLCEHLVDRGHRVICVDNLVTSSLENIEHLRGDAFEFRNHDVVDHLEIAEPVDFVFHFAALASPVDYLRMPLHSLKVGSHGTHNALGLAKWKRARFLLASTSEVYGDPQVHPQPESYWGHVNPIGPRGVYDEAKRYAEALTMAYHNQQGVDTAIVRIFNTFGPRMRPNDGRAIPTFVRQALANEPLTVYGDGSQTRSFCYVDDLIRGIVLLAESGEHLPVNLGNPDERSLLELAETVKRVTGTSSEIVFEALPVDDPQQRRPDITRARQLLGWEPEVSLEDGLARLLRALGREPAAASPSR